MLATPELYKGIIFIRISNLPHEQKVKIRETGNRELIIKILKEDSLINDCILFSDYLEWYKLHKSIAIPEDYLKPIPAALQAEPITN